MRRFYQELCQNLHPLIDNTSVELYTSAARSGDGHASRRLPEPQAPRPAISLIATVKNEGDNISAWLDSLLVQTRPPDEIVIVDGGSTDGTFDALQAFAAHSPIPVKVWQVPGANIARGRNLAIEQAAGPIIACTDAGCQVPPGWLAAISGPFAADPTLEVVAGYYQAIQESDLQRVMAAYFVRPPAEIDPQAFLPSARSLAFHKEAWRAAGGFPEWLTLTAEDTLFDLALKKHTTRWAFVPQAVVRWRLKPTLSQLFRQVRAYGRGDGEAGLFPDQYCSRMRLCAGLSLAGLAMTVCLFLAYFFQTWSWLLVALLPAAWLARRLWQITLRPSWPTNPWQTVRAFILSTAVICTITLAMVVGFIEGVRLRRETSQGEGSPPTPAPTVF